MEDDDRKFYMMWGLAIVLMGIAAALAYSGFWAYGAFLLFGGVGVALMLVSGGESVKFYGGVAFLLLGIVLFGILSGTNPVFMIIAMVIVAGAIVLRYGFRGGEK